LLDLEQSRHCGVRTRNQRLAAVRAFAHFIGLYSPEHLDWSSQIRAIPFKKTSHGLVKRYAARVSARLPALRAKRVSSHTIRYTTATHVLHAGEDINTIRAWLGHISLNTNDIYPEIDLETKARALALCEVKHENMASG
jgi:site-specific recombinase XerC